MQTNTKKQTMSTKPTTTAPAAAPAAAAPKPTHPAPVDYAADFEAMQEAERTHTITFTFTDEEWALIHEDMARFTFMHSDPAPTFAEWKEDRKCGILKYAAHECANAYDRMMLAAAAAKKIGFAFDERRLWQ